MKNINKVKKNLAVMFSIVAFVAVIAVNVYGQKSSIISIQNSEPQNIEYFNYSLQTSESEIQEFIINNNVKVEFFSSEISEDEEYELESWMTEDNFWKITEKFEWDNIEEDEMEIEDWMLTLSLQEEFV
jgi:hypothetical protein